MNYKTGRLNLDHYKAPAARPVFLTPAVHARVAHPWRATIYTAVAGFALAFVAALIVLNLN